MFGLFKKPKVNKFIDFCERADDALTLAYERGDVQAAAGFFHNRLLDYILEEIQSGYNYVQELGIAKYRIRTWDTVIEEPDGNTMKVTKHIRHQDVHIRGMIDIPVGDNIDEVWTLQKNGNNYLVLNIRRV